MNHSRNDESDMKFLVEDAILRWLKIQFLSEILVKDAIFKNTMNLKKALRARM